MLRNDLFPSCLIFKLKQTSEIFIQTSEHEKMQLYNEESQPLIHISSLNLFVNDCNLLYIINRGSIKCFSHENLL